MKLFNSKTSQGLLAQPIMESFATVIPQSKFKVPGNTPLSENELLKIKNIIYGYTSTEFTKDENYQSHLNKYQIKIKFHIDNCKPLREIVDEFFRYCHDEKHLMYQVLSRIDESRHIMYKRFIDKINPYNPTQPTELFDFNRIPYNQLTPFQKTTLNNICKLLKPYVDNITPTVLWGIYTNNPPKAPVIWRGTKEEFNCFIREINIERKHEISYHHNQTMRYYFVNSQRSPMQTLKSGKNYETRCYYRTFNNIRNLFFNHF